jgi:hypothetical protein
MSNALLIIAASLIVGRMVWGLESLDIVVEWTPDGKRLTRQIPAPTGCLFANEMGASPMLGSASPMMPRATSCRP